MSNSSSAERIWSTYDSVQLYSAVGYLLLGTPVFLVNLFIGLCIARYSALRDQKEILIVMGLAFADALNALGSLCAGVYRSVVLLTGSHHTLISQLSCLMTPHLLIWSVSMPLNNLMLVLVSLDRLLLVTLRINYLYSLGSKYTFCMLALPYLGTALFASAAIGAAYVQPNPRNMSPICGSTYAFESGTFLSYLFQKWNSYSVQLFPMVSVILFLAVVPLYKYNLGHSPANLEQQMKRQNRLTKSVAVSVACTFFLSVVPPYFAFRWIKEPGMMFAAYTGFLVKVFANPMCNFWIYQLGHRDLRIAFRSMIRCKELPDNIEMWQEN